MRATGARALERPHRRRGPGRGAGVGVRVRGEATAMIPSARGFARTLIRPTGTFPPDEGGQCPGGRRKPLLLLLA
ncbi:hypothetical protein XAB3213_4460001 [Xanthomonas citri pv. bilvae]|nr:hypothetical protein XAB3213_4460001 [Xanthomonas citri pv. bilvae]